MGRSSTDADGAMQAAIVRAMQIIIDRAGGQIPAAKIMGRRQGSVSR